MTHVYTKEQTFEAIARKAIKEYDPSLLDEAKAIPIEDMVERFYGLTIEYHYIRKNGRILGETIFDDAWVPVYDMDNKEYTCIFVKRGTVIIDASLLCSRKNGRLRFTCAHELAHWIIHYDKFSGSDRTAAMILKPKKSTEEDAAIERQADMLGTACKQAV